MDRAPADTSLLSPEIQQLTFEGGSLLAEVTIPPCYRHAVLELYHPGESAYWESLIAGPLTGASATVTFTLPHPSSRAMIRVKTGDDLTVPPSTLTGSTDFNFLGNADEQSKFLGQLPSAQGAGDGRGILGLYGDTPLATALYADLVKGTGQALGNAISELAAANAAPYTPNNGLLYPGGSFGTKLKDAAKLFKNTDACILGINIGGWDTHTNQGGGTLWDDTIVVTMTEFGRTSKENGSGGHDHAEASVMFVGGGAVNGKVYNCDSSSWDTGATEGESSMFDINNRYLSRRTDFRAVFGEIFMKHFSDTRADLDIVIPGYTRAETDTPLEMTQLGIL